MLRSVTALVMLLAIAFSGCVSDDSGVDAPAVPAGDAIPSTDAPLTDGPPTIDAPEWELAQWWTWHHEAGDFSADWTIVAAEDLGSAWHVAPDAVEPARFDAIYDWYVLGPMDTDTLSDEASGGLQFYEFPLTDGKTWTSVFAPGNRDWELEHTATYDPAIETFQGPAPGYRITATVDGSLFYEYDYVPELGWFSTLKNYVPAVESEERAGELDWTYTVTAAGTDYEGDVYLTSGELLLRNVHEVDLEQMDVEPEPHTSFEVAEDAGALFVTLGAGATAGASTVNLIDPDGERHEVVATSTGLNGQVAFVDAFMPVIPGTWEVVTGGAGLDSGSIVIASQVFEETLTF